MTTTNTDLLTPGEVAAMFGVNAKTVTRWAKTAGVPHLKTPGGHRRFYREDIEARLERSQGVRP